MRAHSPARSTLGVGLALLALVGLGACDSSTTTTTTNMTDAGVVGAGCRAPSACWAALCPCARASLEADCLKCDPAAQPGAVCLCSDYAGSLCLGETQLCVGRAPSVCPGRGARCLPVGQTCSDPVVSEEAAPQLVPTGATDGGAPMFEPRCAYIDDVCCPGT
jgi:hypothetical protein